MEIGVYYESWKHQDGNLEAIPNEINCVYIAFCKPDLVYTSGQISFAGTGVEMWQTIASVRKSIQVLRDRGVMVLLACGGGAYWSQPKTFNAQGVVDLMNDLGCDGIDIDWEVGVADDDAPVNAIIKIREITPTFLCFTGFSTGAFPTDGSKYKGMSIKVLKKCGPLIDKVNVMAYDANQDFDVKKAFLAYQDLYNGSVIIGFEIGVQGWGDALLTPADAQKTLDMVKAEGGHGCFTWAYRSVDRSPAKTGISMIALQQLALKTFDSPPTPKKPYVKPTYSCPSSVYILCPTCQTKIKTAWSL